MEMQEPEPPAPPEEEGDFDLVIEDGMAAAPIAAAPAPAGGEVACSVCGFPMDADWRVCPNCVSRYETECGNCGRQLQAWWLICPWCETPKHPDHIHVHK
jgi:RNA polymerase subunit RPABC4/transcription elongation factor Spt4